MISLEVDYEMADKIIRKCLKESIEDLAKYYKDEAPGILDNDPVKNAKELKKLIKGMVRTHNYYSELSDQLEINDYV